MPTWLMHYIRSLLKSEDSFLRGTDLNLSRYLLMVMLWERKSYLWPWTTKPVIGCFYLFIHNYELLYIHYEKISFPWMYVFYDRTTFGQDKTIWKSGIWGLKKKKLNISKIPFKVVQMKFLTIHITNQKLGFDIFTVGKLQNILMENYL